MSAHFVARVRKDGKITIPKEIRELLKIEPHEFVDIDIRIANWWDLLDWDEMGEEAFNRLPEEIREKIKEKILMRA